VIVSGAYYGQLKVSPYTMYRGTLSGVDGELLRTDGDFGEMRAALAKARGEQP
jgi:hypothetical protein